MYTKNERVYKKGDTSHTFTPFDDEVMKNKNLSPAERLIQVYIKSNKLDWEYSQEIIADNLGISESTVKRAIKKLKQFGYLYITEQQKNKSGKYNKCLYCVTDIPFEFIDENGEIFYSNDNEPFIP